MATIRYVNTAADAGGNGTTPAASSGDNTHAYQTLRQALDALPSTLDDQYTIECTGTADTGDVNQTPWDFTTSATNYLLIRAAAADRFNGVWSDSKYHLSSATNGLYSNTSCHVRIDGIQVKLTGSASESIGIRSTNANQTATGIDYRIIGCAVKSVKTGGRAIGFISYSVDGGATIALNVMVNCVAIDCTTGYSIEQSGTGLHLYNCGSYDSTYGFVDGGDDAVAKNCISHGATFGFVTGFGGTGTGYNAEDDGNGAPGANSRSATTFTFVDAANDNFALAFGDAGAKNYGTSLSADSIYPFSTDVAGATRTGTWDIGPFEETSVVSSVVQDAGTDYIQRTANLPSKDAFTIGGWFKRVTDTNWYEWPINLMRGTNYTGIFISASGDGNNLRLNTSENGSLGWTGEPPVGEWFYLAVSHNGSTITGYWYDSAGEIVEGAKSFSTSLSTDATSEINILNYDGQYVAGKGSQVRVWDAVLSQSEIEAELASPAPVRTANLNTAWDGGNPLIDVSGNDRPWTVNGVTYDFDDAPPDLDLVTFTNLTSGTSTTNGAATASITVPNNGVVYLATAVASSDLNDVIPSSDQPTLTLGGTLSNITWTSLELIQYASRRALRLMRGVNTSGSEQSGTLTLTFASTGSPPFDYQEHMWSIDLAEGASTSDPDDAPVNATTTVAVTSLDLPDVGTPNTGDAVYVAFAFEGAADNFALEPTIAQLGSQTGGANTRTLKTGWTVDNETPGVTWTTSGNGAGGIGLIVNLAEATTPAGIAPIISYYLRLRAV